MGTQYRRDPDRDAWDRQPGEPGEQFDWFTHWRNDGHRRSMPRTADKFSTTPAKVRTAARKYEWSPRLQSWRAAQSAQIQERFDEVMEQGLAPFAQAFARMAALAASNDGDRVAPDRAASAAATMLKVAKEPTTRELLRVAQAGGDQRDVGNLLLESIAAYPEAKDAAVRALEQARADGQAG